MFLERTTPSPAHLTPTDVVAIGEVLWDVVGAEKHLGGAPFNFAVHCRHLGARSAIVSRVGRDELGDEILARARDLGVDTSLIQRDLEHPTGQVRVTLHAHGQPEFDICTGLAYDYLAASPAAIERVRAADVVCFGTLAQRHPVALQSIATLLEAASLRQPFTSTGLSTSDKAQDEAQGSAQALLVCDLNLRPPHYSAEVVRNSLARCHLLKLNGDELCVVQEMLGRDGRSAERGSTERSAERSRRSLAEVSRRSLDEDDFLLHLLDAYELELVCVTLGARGCILRTLEERVAAPGYPCRVVDTIGSGDAFTAALVIKYLAGWPLAEVADFANLVGAYVATQHGATPPITPDALEGFANK